jgi:nitroreductase
MELQDAVRRRRMVRRYTGQPLPAGVVDELAEIALHAPSAGFTQAVSLLICQSEADRGTFWSAAWPAGGDGRWLRGMRTAPALILVWTSERAYLERYAESDKDWTDRDPTRWSAPYWWVDAGMATMVALLAAVDSGLGAAFFGIPTDRIPAVRAAFGVPEDQLSVGVISVGYRDPAERPTGSPTRRRRKSRHELIRYGQWE